MYTVFHRAADPARGGVLIASPWAAERADSYLACVRWARKLAARGWNVLRFDYRGIGESTGEFEDFTMDHWRADVRAAAAVLRQRCDGPMVIHGMRLGASLAADAFDEGIGDALLLWAPPESARAHLWEGLRSTLAADMVRKDGPRRTRDDCVREMESGGRINVGGYFWTGRLWASASDRPLRAPGDGRARRIVDVRTRAGVGTADPSRVQIVGARFWEESTRVTADIEALAADALAWLSALSLREAGWSEGTRRSA